MDMLAQAYRWTLDDIKKLSYVQVLLIQHSAWHNRRVLDKRLEEGREKGNLSPTEELGDAELFGGKRADELSSTDLMILAGKEGKAPRVIKLRKDPPDEQAEIPE